MKLRKQILWTLISILSIGLTCCKDDTPYEAPDIKGQLDSANVALDTLLSNLSEPWGIEFINDAILITDKNGSLLLWDGINTTNISGVPAFRQIGQGGLLDVCKHPDFASNNLVYLCGSYGPSDDEISTTLFRGELSGTSLTNVQELFTVEPKNNSWYHFGARITFDQSNHVYLSTGERNDWLTAQDRTNHNGCVVRLNDDGSIPTDNPYIDSGNYKNEIFTYGHRNVQGMVLNPLTGDIWTHEHGPKGGDEVNILTKGGNYGWPLATYGINYDGDTISNDTFITGTEAPIYYWVPSIAPCGMEFYNSDSIPQWKGSLFLGALAGKHLNRLTIENDKVIAEERLLQDVARFRDMRQGPDGSLYVITESPGMLLRLRPE